MNPGAAILQLNTLFHKRYRVVRCIKAGGMGAVYEVQDEVTARRRALKVMLPSLVDSDDLRARFALEARITGSIESDHIVRTSDAGVDEETETPFLIMELLHGEDLGSLIKRSALPHSEVCLYLFQVGLALDKTHAASIIHRDLKPDNLFLTLRDDGSPCIKILDFGIAKVVQSLAATMTNQVLGTPLYMAAEQIRAEKNLGPAVDIHALGHVAYTLLVGENYWAEEASSIPWYLLASEVLHGPEESPSGRAHRRRGQVLPQSFDVWFRKATALRAEDRFTSASLAISALADALDVVIPSAPRISVLPSIPAEILPAPSASEATVMTEESVPPKKESPRISIKLSTSEETVPTGREPPRLDIPSSSTLAKQETRFTGQAAPATNQTLNPRSSVGSSEPRTPASPAAHTVGLWSSVRSSEPQVSNPPAAQIVGSRSVVHSGEPPPSSPTLSRRDRPSQRRFRIVVDTKNNILKLKVWGFWTVDEAKAYLEDFRQKANTVIGKPWYVLADISEFPPQKAEVNPYVEQTMAFAQANGMKKAANLVSSALTRMQISRLSSETKLPEYSFFTSESDAIAWLLKEDLQSIG